MGGDLEHTKNLLRQRLLRSRAMLPADTAARLAAAACARVTALSPVASAGTVVAYRPLAGEADPAPVVSWASRLGKRVYYPADPASRPAFVSGYPGGTALEDDAPDVVFVVPGVAFDARGARLGRGRGWYDRALVRHPRALRVGLAFELQVVEAVPEEAWDVRMDAVATEARLLVSSGKELPT
ncbi:MAG TPA: 5-formyltetrahydrofolate cyclo-ligase [Candidatus Binatia bacterium]|nr:5-formyltetrahydrofolate cyclo-ligase [Candidatus Binatia bacterium]